MNDTLCPYCQQQHESDEVNGCRQLWLLQFSDLLERMTDDDELAEFTREILAVINEDAEL